MFKFFKNIFVSKPTERDAVRSNISVRSTPPPLQRPAAHAIPVPAPSRFQPPSRPQASPGISGGGGSRDVQLPLQMVMDRLPMELKARIRQNDVGIAQISVSLEKILSQLSLGSVKITFGELRRAAPQVFSSQNDLDQTQVALPLGEILSQLNPALLFRRQNQKHIEVPEEIRSPFGDNGQGLIFSVGPGKAAAPSPARAATPAPAPMQQALASSVSLPPRQPSPAPAPVTLPTVPFRPSLNSAPAPAASPANRGVSHASMVSTPNTAASAQPAARSTAFAGQAGTINVPLTALNEGWPESLKLEIAQLDLADAKLAVPVDTLKEALQRGKVFFPWKLLRSWIRPAPEPAVSAHDNTSLELPLRVIAPLFVAKQRDLAAPGKKVAIDETIPNLFFGFPQPEGSTNGTPAPAGCAVTKPVDTNYYSLSDSLDGAASDAVVAEAPPVKRTGPSGTAFLARCATPNEIVSRAAALNEVSGALIALPDGLMVASKLSADLNGDTLAAFLPQIFGKVNQCTKELRMGELNNLNFTVGNVPWKIFRVNAIFFAAFGRAGQPLPTAELASLAGELDHKKQ